MSRVVTAVSSIKLGTVDIRSLKHSAGAGAFLTDLVRREGADKAAAARFVFLGPVLPVSQSPANSSLSLPPSGLPEMLYLQYGEHRQLTLGDAPSLVQMPPMYSPSGSEYSVPLVRQPVRFQRPQGSFANHDAIDQLMRQMGGHTIYFSTPEEFQIALDRMDSLTRAVR